MVEKKKLYMEEINSLASDAVDDILASLEEYDLDVDEETKEKILEDDLWQSIVDHLSGLTVQDYKNHM